MQLYIFAVGMYFPTTGLALLLICAWSQTFAFKASVFTKQTPSKCTLKDSLGPTTNSRSKIELKTVSKVSIASHRNKSTHLQRNLAILPISAAIFLSGCLLESSVVFATGEEAVQLLYGYHTNIPSVVTWTVLLYGAYKMYFTVFRWLASW